MGEGGTRAKNDPKLQKIMSRSYIKSQELYTSMVVTLVIIFHFFKILIFWVFKGIKGQKMTQNYQFQSIILYISRTVNHIIKIFGTQV